MITVFVDESRDLGKREGYFVIAMRSYSTSKVESGKFRGYLNDCLRA